MRAIRWLREPCTGQLRGVVRLGSNRGRAPWHQQRLVRGGDITQAHTPPASTITERTPPAKRTLPATIKECVMRTRDPWCGGAHGVDGRYNAWRSGAPGPQAHRNAATQVVDDRRPEVHGQQKPSNDPRNNQHNLGTPTTGHC